MRILSVTVKEKRPIVETLEFLAAYAPFSGARARLHLAIREIAGGAHWCDALQQARLVNRPQAAVFKSAERAGNLAWALDEMSDSTVRRTTYRAQLALNFLFPVMVLGFGMCVFFVAVAMLLPLFKLISALA
jgi:type II secretory pathway component PulF